MDITHVWQAWPAINAVQVRPLRRGANNAVSLVETAAGGLYIVSESAPDHAEHLQHEIRIVTRLQHANLPFAVPAPIPTHSGDLLLRLPDAESGVAMLWPFVPGRHSTGNNRAQARSAGRALARLHAALANLEHTEPPLRAPPAAGELQRCHPLVRDPLAMVERLPVDRRSRARVRALIVAVRAGIPRLYATLPQQLIHNDYDPSNVLLDGQHVTGVLDWEFSTVDLRAMDVAVALLWWPRAPRGSERSWAIMDAFGQGYSGYRRLTIDELEALPSLMRLRIVATLLHRFGRYLAGRDPEDRLVQRISWTLSVDDWISSTGKELCRRARVWSQG